ncbi:MAG: hypothetical protein RIR51_2030, partial [Bacteroidota bacterium]
MNYGLRTTSGSRAVTNYELQAMNYELRVHAKHSIPLHRRGGCEAGGV